MTAFKTEPEEIDMNETQSLLTDAERAEGWQPGDTMPNSEALVEVLWLEGSPSIFNEAGYPANAFFWAISEGRGRLRAWRPHGQPAKAEPTNAEPTREEVYASMAEEFNRGMLARDQPRPVAAPVSTPAPRVERSPLLTIAPIPRTGFSFWGEQS